MAYRVLTIQQFSGFAEVIAVGIFVLLTGLIAEQISLISHIDNSGIDNAYSR